MTQPDVLRPLACGAGKHLGGRGVRVLLKEMMLHHPGIVVAKLIGELELLERLLQQVVFAGRRPWPRQLMLIEHAKLHAQCSFRQIGTVSESYSYSQSYRTPIARGANSCFMNSCAATGSASCGL